MANDIGEIGYVHPSGTVVHVPSAHSVQVSRCGDPECGHIHVFLLDPVGQPIAEATLDDETVLMLLRVWGDENER